MKLFNKQKAFTLIELLVALVIIGILSAIAIPNYLNYIVRGSRSAVQTELVQMAALQEKIYLNDSSYAIGSATSIITTNYNGKSDGGLGIISGLSKDSKYIFTCVSCTASAYTLTATPDPTKSQQNDGSLSIDQTGYKVWTGGSAATW